MEIKDKKKGSEIRFLFYTYFNGLCLYQNTLSFFVSKRDTISIIAIPKNTRIAPYLVTPTKKPFIISVNRVTVALGGKIEVLDILTLLVK